MTFLPIVERELRVAARRRGTYHTRAWAVLVAGIVFGWQMLVFTRDRVASSTHGLMLFTTLCVLAFFYCLMIGARVTADCLSEEKREGTLGLLFLTDLKGYDVVLGKLAASSLNAFYGLLAILPVLALPILLGGVHARQFWQMALVLINTLFYSLAIGIFVSTISRNERKALFATVLIIALATVTPIILGVLIGERYLNSSDPRNLWPLMAFSPGFGFMSARFGNFPFLPPESFWASLAIVHLLGWAFLVRAWTLLPRLWQDKVARPWVVRWRERLQQWNYGSPETRRSYRTRLLDINPFYWLAGRDPWKPKYVWIFLGALMVCWLAGLIRYGRLMYESEVLVPLFLLCHTFLKIWVISEACSRLVEDRRSGALELLLSTPLTVAEILRGQWRHMQRLFAAPMAVMLGFELALLVAGVRPNLPSGQINQWCSTMLAGMGMFVADFIALVWVGMWLGLSSNNVNRAIIGTAGLILVLPWGIYLGLSFLVEMLARTSLRLGEPDWVFEILAWFLIGLINNVVWGELWARRKLTKEFRRVAMHRGTGGASIWNWILFWRRRREAVPAGMGDF